MNSKEELKKELTSKVITAGWEVLCDIGPNWIGSRRNIAFYLDESPLEESDFISFLIERLIEVMEIPSYSEYHVIKGSCTFSLNGSDLILEYETVTNIPYDDKFNLDNGVKVFLANI